MRRSRPRLRRSVSFCELVLGGLLCGLLGGAAIASPSATDPSALGRLRRMVRLHPDDPDLAWALARRLALDGRADEALVAAGHYLDQWPDRRPRARTELAHALLEGGAPGAALRVLDEAPAETPDAGLVQFYRGLALRAEERLVDANRAFEQAGRLEPALRSETLLARALGHFRLGEDEVAVALLKELLQRDPTAETALRARLLLRQRELLGLERPWRLEAYAGFEWDDNVTLESSENELPASERDDFRGIWGAGATWRPWLGERGSLALGYRYDQSRHHDLHRFDVIGNTFFASGAWRATERLTLRLDALGWSTLQDGDPELSGGALRPNVLLSLGPQWGVLRSFAQVEVLEYHDDPVFDQWDRDAVTMAFGLEHILRLTPGGSWVALSASFQRNLTQAGSNGTPDALDGDYDYDSWRTRLLANLQLPLDLRGRIDAVYSHDDYLNDNVSYFLQTLGGLRRRTDDVLSARVALSRVVHPKVELEVSWRGTKRISNVDVFDYDRQVVGALVRVSTD